MSPSPPAGADLHPQLDPTPLALARYPTGFRPDPWPVPFAALVDDGTEATLLCSEADLDRQPAALAVERGWRRITFPGPLPWDLVGFLADVAGRLAGAAVPLACMAGFTTDHVLVRVAQAEHAVAVLRGDPVPQRRRGVTNP